MYRITSHQVADLFFPGPARLSPEKGSFLLRQGCHSYPSVPPHVIGRLEVFALDGLIEIELVDDQAVAS